MGGAAAMNIHGKNNYALGPFGECVKSFDLMTARGELVHVTAEGQEVPLGVLDQTLGLEGNRSYWLSTGEGTRVVEHDPQREPDPRLVVDHQHPTVHVFSPRAECGSAGNRIRA